MKFHSGISKEVRTMLTNDLQCYVQEVKMSKSEYKELCRGAKLVTVRTIKRKCARETIADPRAHPKYFYLFSWST